jgi:hypothetical protein
MLFYPKSCVNEQIFEGEYVLGYRQIGIKRSFAQALKKFQSDAGGSDHSSKRNN